MCCFSTSLFSSAPRGEISLAMYLKKEVCTIHHDEEQETKPSWTPEEGLTGVGERVNSRYGVDILLIVNQRRTPKV